MGVLFPHACICPVQRAVCWAQQEPLYWRLIQPGLGFQLAALPSMKPLFMTGVGRSGPTKLKVEVGRGKSLYSHWRGIPACLEDPGR